MWFCVKWPISSVFFLAIFMLILLLNQSFFHAKETFYNDINPIFENSTIFVDEIEKESPFYKNFLAEKNECKSNLIDLFEGNLKTVYDKIDLNQFTFIYMYANWCARSRSLRKVINRLACSHSNEIAFLAINCFNPNGECRKSFNLVKYPQILLQIRDVGLLAYNGPVDFNYLSNYLKLVQQPLNRIEDLEEFVQFVLVNDGTLVGHFDFGNDEDDKLFKTFYQTSLSSLTLNFENPIRFSVVLNRTLWEEILNFGANIKSKNESDNSPAKLVAFSSYGLEKIFKNVKNISVEILIKWTQKALKEPALKWYFPDKPTKKSDVLRKLLVFVDRHLSLENDQMLDKNLIILKHFALKNNRKASKRPDLEENEFLKITLKYLENKLKSQLPDKIENNHLTEFYQKGEVVLIDKNLYQNYAYRLAPNNSFALLDPFIVLVETKNQTLHIFQNDITYNSISEFIQNHLLNLNKKYERSRETNDLKNKVFSNIIDIDVRTINLILGAEKSEWQINDLLIFFYNNWCGFCKSLNFNLVTLMENYFPKTDTLKLLKINVQENDLPFNLYMPNIPALLFIPAHSTLKESIIYNYHKNNFDKKHLLSFILMNSQNINTIKQFFTLNVLNNHKLKNLSKKSMLRYDFINLIERKIKGLENNLNKNFEYRSFLNYTDNLYFLKLKEEIFILKEFISKFI